MPLRGQPDRSGSKARPSSPTSFCRPAPTSSAGTSASSPTAPATSPQLHPVQPPRDQPAEEVHRAAGRVQVRLRHLRRAGQTSMGVGRAFHRRRHDRTGLGASTASPRPTCPSTSPGRSSRRRDTSWCPCPRTRKSTPALRWFAEGRKQTRPTGDRGLTTRSACKGLQTHDRQDRVRQLQPASGSSPTWSTERPALGRSTSERGKGHHTASSTASIRCRWCRRTRASASTPWATPRTVG